MNKQEQVQQMTMFAISAPAPVLSSAEARDSVPPKRKMVLRCSWGVPKVRAILL